LGLSAIIHVMSWSGKRKFIYIGTIVAIFLLVVVLPAVLSFYKAPTCFDGKQNQTEQGIDCGGPCTLLCPSQYGPLIVKWSKFAKVVDGVYNVVAYIENPNLNAGADNLNYSFKLYDKAGVLLRERFGSTFAPANKIMAVFEAELSTGNQIPSRVEFSFTNQAVWVKQVSKESGLAISQSEVTKADTSPRLSATITNNTVSIIKNIEAVAIVYNNADNTIAFSRTKLDSIDGKGSQVANFNWPKPFSENYVRTEIILKILK